jgi:hypothetical protein
MWGRGIRRGLMRGGDKDSVGQAKMNGGGKQQCVTGRTDGVRSVGIRFGCAPIVNE